MQPASIRATDRASVTRARFGTLPSGEPVDAFV
jgi:hypothetical protein